MKSNWNYPTTMWVGENRVTDLGIACKTLNINKPLLVTDKDLAKSNIIIDVLKNLKEEGFVVNLYSNVVGNPTGKNVTEGVDCYNINGIGGGHLTSTCDSFLLLICQLFKININHKYCKIMITYKNSENVRRTINFTSNRGHFSR